MDWTECVASRESSPYSSLKGTKFGSNFGNVFLLNRITLDDVEIVEMIFRRLTTNYSTLLVVHLICCTSSLFYASTWKTL